MPNWAHNTLDVTGPADELARYVEHVKTDEQPLTFTADVPEPADPGDYDWYGWRVTYWGTKWDASFNGPMVAVGADTMDVDASTQSQGVQAVPDAAVYKFDTAWSPPTPWLVTTAAEWPALTFVLRWGEVGSETAGMVVCSDGAVVDVMDLELEDVLAPEEFWF
jgi:hypothetical protein